MTESASGVARLEAVRTDAGTVLRVSGRLDVESTPALWDESRPFVESGARPAGIDASGVETCDSAGAAWILWVGAPVSGANEQVASLIELVRPRDAARPTKPREADAPSRETLVARIGHAAMQSAKGFHWSIAYVGAIVEGLFEVVRRPGSLRRRDVLLYMTRTGHEALPIVALITFLVGVIIAFQSAMQLKRYGTELYVADAVALTMVMELGPLMTAIIMAGRSGSAFAAEIGTMKVNEEVDALDTMGLDTTRFLVMPKFVALLLMMPLLVTFASFCGIAGGLLIGTTSLELPASLYLKETVEHLTLWRAAQGYIKAECYAVVIAGVGCLRGLQTRVGAQGVGLAATSAVVSSIFFIVVVDGVLTVIFYHVG
jgi:phospholipid/cholesterol/gamma-HCH transport system permease protein